MQSPNDPDYHTMFKASAFPTGETIAMLDVLRRNAGSWAIKFILTFIALTFIWWGVGTYSESGRDVAATVAGENITLSELSEAVAGLEKTYRDAYGNAFTPEVARTLNLRRQALDALVRRKLLLAEAETMGISATDEEVRRTIATTPGFQVDGVFREDRYKSILSYNRVTPAEYESSMREEITVRKVEDLLAASGRVTESEARELFNLTFRKIRLLVVSADPSGMRGIGPATDEEIAAMYDRTKESYRIPVRMKLSVARFSAETFAAKVDPTEQEVRSFYEGNADLFRDEESRLVHPFTVPYGAGGRDAALEKAEKLLAQAKEGKARFEEIAKSVAGSKAGEVWMTRKEIRPELAAAVFSAPVDAVVGPIDTGSGLTIVRVNRIRFPEALPFDQVRSRVETLLKRESGKDLAVVRAYEAHRKATESRDLAGACAEFGIAPAETGWVSAGTEESGVPAAVVQEALLLQEGEIGPVQTVGDAHYLFRVIAREPSRIPPLEDVRKRVADAVRKEKRDVAARTAVEEALSGAKSASDVERNAKRSGLSATTTPFFPVLAGSLPESLASAGDIRRDLLDLSPKSPVLSKVFEAGNGFLGVAYLAEQPVEQKEWEEGRESFIRTLAERKRSDAVEAFLAARLARADLTINPEALK